MIERRRRLGMKLNHEEKKTLRLEFCERCAIISNPAVAFSECERERVFQNLLRSGFRPV
jgi:hypothetical protein